MSDQINLENYGVDSDIHDLIFTGKQNLENILVPIKNQYESSKSKIEILENQAHMMQGALGKDHESVVHNMKELNQTRNFADSMKALIQKLQIAYEYATDKPIFSYYRGKNYLKVGDEVMLFAPRNSLLTNGVPKFIRMKVGDIWENNNVILLDSVTVDDDCVERFKRFKCSLKNTDILLADEYDYLVHNPDYACLWTCESCSDRLTRSDMLGELIKESEKIADSI